MKQHAFLALAMRQSLIRRWSLMRSIAPESVMEHAASCGTIVLLAGMIAREQGRPLDLERMLAHALVHDMSEVFVSDVVTPVKKASPLLEAEFKRLEAAADHQLLEALPEQLRQPMATAFALDGYEARLFKACDTYSAWVKAKLEIAAGNGGEFQQAFDTLSESVELAKQECPELIVLDDWFGGMVGASVDALMSS